MQRAFVTGGSGFVRAPVVRRAALELKRAFIARIEPNAVLSVLLERGAWLERARRMKPLKGEI